MRVSHECPGGSGLAVAILVVTALGLAGGARGQAVTEFVVPTDRSGLEGIAAGSDGALWFTESTFNKIGRITTAGVITEFAIPTANSGPFKIAAGPDGALWFTEYGRNKIGRITTAGVITEFAIPTASSLPHGIAAGSDGALWFTEGTANKIGRITTAGVITEFAIPSAVGGGIAAGPDGALWFTEVDKIGRITTAGVITEFAIPTANSAPEGIAAGLDGALWFAELGANKIGRITTTGVITEFAVTQFPHEIAAGPDGALWFTESATIGRITTAGVFTEFTNPTNSLGTSFGIAAGPDGALWFTEYNDNEIGRITTGAICNIDATTLCLSGGRFKVQARWATADGRSGDGQAISLTGDTGYFWFFSSSNVEMVIKALNACSLNSQFWVFAGGLTDVQVDLTVTDTVTNTVKTYRNPQSTPFKPIQDTAAFATCSVGFASLLSNTEEGAATPSLLERNTRSAEMLALRSAAVEQACTANAGTLCLSNNRFKVTATWQSPTASGQATAAPLTPDTGYFWFFNSANVEMIVKVLDGCSLNSKKWAFAGGLTNVNVVLTFTDTQTGAIKTYVNPANTAFLPIQDTSAFPTCP